MNIGILSTPHVPTPPRGYGASELIAGQLAEGLVRRGHHVRLFANEESTRGVHELFAYPQARLGRTFDDRELIHVAHAMRDLGDCEVIHNHCVTAGPAFARLAHRPFLTTLHYTHPMVRIFADGPYVAVSERQRTLLPDVNVARVVHNGIDLRDFPLGGTREDYLLFLGRFHPNKGTDLAIEVACRLGMRLIIAAPGPPPNQQDWFDAAIKPRLGGPIEWIGPVEGRQRAQVYGRALATLVPIRWEEPFGLVIAESMACGTPPIAFRRGAAPELIQDGISGFLVDSLDEMTGSVARIGEIDPLACRRRVAGHFDVDRMVDAYVALYQDQLNRWRESDRDVARLARAISAAC